MSTFGDRLRSERESLGLSQTQFGELGGVKKGAQANYETGERSPDAAYLIAIQPRVDVWFILTGDRFPAAADSITGPAARLLEMFNAMPNEAQSALLGVAEVMAGKART